MRRQKEDEIRREIRDKKETMKETMKQQSVKFTQDVREAKEVT